MKEKIVILTHKGWGKNLIEGVEIICGKVDFVSDVALTPNDTLDDFTLRVKFHLERIFKENGDCHITFFTDLFGGTTTNVAAVIANSEPEKFSIITGLNAPLLLESCLQIQANNNLNLDLLLANTQNSIFDVMKKLGKG